MQTLLIARYVEDNYAHNALEKLYGDDKATLFLFYFKVILTEIKIEIKFTKIKTKVWFYKGILHWKLTEHFEKVNFKRPNK